MKNRSARSRGVTLVEVVVAVVVVLVGLLLVAMMLPRSRETARLSICQRNLMTIGQAIAYYDTATGHLPTVPAAGASGTAPLRAMLGQLGLGDFSPLANPNRSQSLKFLPGPPPAERYIAGFTCPSDHNALPGRFPAPISYRSNTGGSPDGTGGPFEPGRVVPIREVADGDGVDFTAAFGERLVGSGTGAAGENDYALVDGPISGLCPPLDPASLKTDAGRSWADAGWVSTLYNHATPPQAASSCVARDGRSARIGASSGHARTIHVLMIGGSVRSFTPTVNPEVWRRFGTIKDLVAPAALPEPAP